MTSVRVRAQRLSARIGRWPRRIAALGCLLLAAGSTLTPPAAPGRAAESLAARLRPGEVAVPVPISAGAQYAHPGDRIGVLASAEGSSRGVLIADHVRVLDVRGGDSSLSGDSTSTVVVAVQRDESPLLAGYSTDRLVLILDDLP